MWILTVLSLSDEKLVFRILVVLHLTLLKLFLPLLFSLPASAQISISEQRGDYQVELSAPGEGRTVSATVSDNVAQRLARYQGKCVDDAKISFLTMQPAPMQLFVKSGDFADLEAEDILGTLGDLLVQACPELQSISVFLSMLPTNTALVTLYKEDNWSVSGSTVPDRFVPSVRASQLVTAFMQPQGIECHAEIDVLLDGFSSPSRALAKPYSDFRFAANNGAMLLDYLCPDANMLRFHPDSLPKGLICDADDGQCYLKATWNTDIQRVKRERPSDPRQIMAILPELTQTLDVRNENWLFEPVGYAQDPAFAPSVINTADDMIKYISGGEFGLIQEGYSSYFRVFHNLFLRAYSDQCRAHIANPVTFNVTPIEETVYGDGSRSGPRQVGDTYQITLDDQFDGRYRDYTTANKLFLLSKSFSRTLELRGKGGGAGIESVVGWVLSDKSKIDSFVQKGCKDEQVGLIYQSLPKVLFSY